MIYPNNGVVIPMYIRDILNPLCEDSPRVLKEPEKHILAIDSG